MNIALSHLIRISFAILSLATLSHAARAVEFAVVEELDSSQSGVVIGGTVIPYRVVTLAAQVSGRVQFIGGEVGDKTKTQQILTKINDDDLLAKRRSAVAQINSAQAALHNAQIQYNRELWSPRSERLSNAPGGMGLPFMFDQFFTRNLSNMSGGGYQHLDRQADLVEQRSHYNQAQYAVMQAYSSLEGVDAQLRNTHAVAPFDGVILKKYVEIGDTVQAGQAMLEVGRTDFLRIQAEIPARIVPLLKRGEFVSAKLDIADTIVQARISQIYPAADPGRHTVTVKFDLPIGVPGGPGMYVEVTIADDSVTDDQPVLVAPKSALVKRGSLPYVFVKSEQEVVNLRLIRLGREISKDQFIVLSGLKAGEQLLLNPPSGIASGWSPAGTVDKRLASH